MSPGTGYSRVRPDLVLGPSQETYIGGKQKIRNGCSDGVISKTCSWLEEEVSGKFRQRQFLQEYPSASSIQSVISRLIETERLLLDLSATLGLQFL